MKIKTSMDSMSSPDELLALIGYSPADNTEGYTTYVPWLSRLVGGHVRSCFQLKNILDSISRQPTAFGPLAFAAASQRDFLETWVTGPIRDHSKNSTRLGHNPDIYIQYDEYMESAYARRLYRLCGRVIRKGKFNNKETRFLATTLEGQAILKQHIREFAKLEHSYSALGLSRLKALKELLQTLIMVITEKPMENIPLPLMKRDKEGRPLLSHEEYIAEARVRLENLYAHNAFHIKTYSERATKGKIGCSYYEVVKGSQLHSVTLRHYPLPEGYTPNGKVLYLASPLINKPEIYDLAEGKSVIEGMLKEGYTIYLVDPGDPGPEGCGLGLDFYGKTVQDHYIQLIKERHPNQEIDAMGYCMGGTLFLPYLARRAEERLAQGKPLDIQKVALMASPFKFDDDTSGHSPMRKTIFADYDSYLMSEMYGDVNIPPQVIEVGMNEIQPGVRYNVANGFYSRAGYPGAIEDAAPFLYWLTHGTKFAAKAHSEWIKNIFVGNGIVNGTYTLSSCNPDLDGKPVDMEILKKANVTIFDYRGIRDPISPTGSCVASELWGKVNDGNITTNRNTMNRTVEKNIGHIFVVSRKLLAEFIDSVSSFFREE